MNRFPIMFPNARVPYLYDFLPGNNFNQIQSEYYAFEGAISVAYQLCLIHPDVLAIVKDFCCLFLFQQYPKASVVYR